jgi:hypothetical protein
MSGFGKERGGETQINLGQIVGKNRKLAWVHKGSRIKSENELYTEGKSH